MHKLCAISGHIADIPPETLIATMAVPPWAPPNLRRLFPPSDASFEQAARAAGGSAMAEERAALNDGKAPRFDTLREETSD